MSEIRVWTAKELADLKDTGPFNHIGFVSSLEFDRTKAELALHKDLLRKAVNRCADMKEALEFYANPESWCSDGFNFRKTDIIDSQDCSDYPHVTRDVKFCGGKLARKTLAELNESL